MRIDVRRNLAAAAVAPLLLLTLVACGDDDSGGDASEPDTATTATTSAGPDGEQDPGEGTQEPGTEGSSTGESEAQGSESVDLPTGDVDVADFVSVVRAGMDAVTTADIMMEADFEGEGEGGTGEGVLDVAGERDALRFDLSDEQSGEAGTFVMIDGVVFLKEDAASDAKYVRLEPKGEQGVTFYSLFHPHQLTDLFLDHTDSVEHLGSETVAEVQTEHYRMAVDPKALMTLFGGIFPGGGEEPESTSEQVWLDDQGRLVRMRVEIEDTEDAVVIETTLTGFGEAPTVEEPPASEVTDPH